MQDKLLPYNWSLFQWIKNSLIFGLSCFLLRFVAILPLKVALWLASILSYLFVLIDRPNKRNIEKNIRMYGKECKFASSLIRKNTISIIKNLAIGLVFLAHLRYKRIQNINSIIKDEENGLSLLKQIVEEGKGVIFITGHIGNWELMAAYLGLNGLKVAVIARKSYDPRFTRLIEEWRKSWNVETIWREERDGPRKILKRLKEGYVVGFLIDQKTSLPSVYVPFLGKPAPTPIGPAKIIAQVKLPVVLGALVREEGTFLYKFILKDISKIVNKDPVAITEECTNYLEDIIKEYPEQWVWMHNRWG